MSYQVLARKWRPNRFAELVGQEHVVSAISNALDNHRLHHAYLFTGTRGVGKTTIARIFAKSLNCEEGMSSSPCGKCNACLDIEQGNYVDLLEIDAASRTKVEDTRELLENVQYKPSRGEYKVYLIDEVHMLSKHSFNALLKTLEEPPPHVKFLLATTDPQKLPITILSRCLQFNLKALSREQISGQLEHILQQEKIEFAKGALALLARAAQGSMRDALSLTDQAIAQGNGQVDEQVVTDMLGLMDKNQILKLLNAIAHKNAAEMMAQVDAMAQLGADYGQVLAELMSLLHQVALTQIVPDVCKLETTSAKSIYQLAKQIPAEQIQLLYQIAIQGKQDIGYAAEPRIGLEMTLMRMLAFVPEKVAMSAPELVAQAGKQASIQQIPHTSEQVDEDESLNRPAGPSTQSDSDGLGVTESLADQMLDQARVEPASTDEAAAAEHAQEESVYHAQFDAEQANILAQAQTLHPNQHQSDDFEQGSGNSEALMPSEQVANMHEADESPVAVTGAETSQSILSESEAAPADNHNHGLSTTESLLKLKQNLRQASHQANAAEAPTDPGKKSELAVESDTPPLASEITETQSAVTETVNVSADTSEIDQNYSQPFSARSEHISNADLVAKQAPVSSLDNAWQPDDTAAADETNDPPPWFDAEIQVAGNLVGMLDKPSEGEGELTSSQDPALIDPVESLPKQAVQSARANLAQTQPQTAYVDFEIPAYLANNEKVMHASQLDTWSQLIEQTGVAGLTKQLALHANYQLLNGTVELLLDKEKAHLDTPQARTQLLQALSQTLGQDLQLSVVLGEPKNTPFNVQRQINLVRQQHAEKVVETDAGIQLLQQTFAARPVEASIKPR